MSSPNVGKKSPWRTESVAIFRAKCAEQHVKLRKTGGVCRYCKKEVVK